jgi:hypothetical protein
MENKTSNYKPLNLEHHSDVLERIRKFEAELSAEFDQTVSVVAYSSHSKVKNPPQKNSTKDDHSGL